MVVVVLAMALTQLASLWVGMVAGVMVVQLELVCKVPLELQTLAGVVVLVIAVLARLVKMAVLVLS